MNPLYAICTCVIIATYGVMAVAAVATGHPREAVIAVLFGASNAVIFFGR
jgi:hypothetical protein